MQYNMFVLAFGEKEKNAYAYGLISAPSMSGKIDEKPVTVGLWEEPR